MRKIKMLCAICILSTGIIGCSSYVPEGYYISNNSLSDSQEITEEKESENVSEVSEVFDINSEDDIEMKEVYPDMDSASMITINGEQYDISHKFDQVAKSMRDNGIELYWQKGTTIGTYDENIQILGEDIYMDANTNNMDIDVDSDNTINAIKYFSETNLESNYNLSVYCSCYNFNSDKINFETHQGITEYSDINDLRNLNNKAVNIDTPESFVCDALCVNGKIISLDDYNLQYEQWIEDLNTYSLTDAVKKHFPNYNYQLLAWILDVDWFEISDAAEFKKATEMMGGDYKQQILFAFALQDMGAKLENGEIDNFIIIRYVGTVGENINIQAIYYKYVLIDKTEINWDVGLQL
ncbi:MAG: hypothetical protein J6C06_06605 [Lachnospiraceae bacterium]|nr:hypothetical protein [Lachnospiraceae bacterium]